MDHQIKLIPQFAESLQPVEMYSLEKHGTGFPNQGNVLNGSTPQDVKKIYRQNKFGHLVDVLLHKKQTL